MARTAEVSIIIRNNGTQVGVVGYNIIDLKGTLTGADEGNGVIGITGSGGGAGTNVATEVVAGTQSGSNVTLDLSTLSHTFVAVEVIFASGQALTPVTDWSLVGSIATVSGANAAQAFQVQYTY